MTDIVQKTVGANALYVIDESNNTLVVDQTNGRVGINNTNPGYNLTITGATHTSANLSAGTDLFLVDEGNSRVSVGTTTGVAGFSFNVAGNTTLVGDVLTGTAMKWVNSTGRLGIGTTSPDAPLHVTITNDGEALRLETTNSSSNTNASPDLAFVSAKKAVNDYLGSLQFKGINDVDSVQTYSQIISRIDNPSDGAEAGSMFFTNMHQGNNRTFLWMEGSSSGVGFITTNYNGQDINFGLQNLSEANGGPGGYGLYHDASTGRIGLNDSSPASTLEITSIDDGNPEMRITRSGATTQYLGLTNEDAAGGLISMHSGESNKKGLYIQAVHNSGGSAAGGNFVSFRTGPASSPVERMQITDNTSAGASTTDPQVIIQSGTYLLVDDQIRLGAFVSGPTPTDYSLSVSKGSSTLSGGLFSQSVGESAIGNTNAGWWLTANGMNTSSKYTPAIKFGSTDPQLTTDNPKYLAGIVGRATETYSADTDGGMALDFLTFPNSSSATGGPTTRMTINHNGQVGIGAGLTSPSAAFHVRTQNDASTFVALFESEDDGSSASPDIGLLRDSASPAASDDLGHFRFRGIHSGGSQLDYADMYAEIGDPTDGAEAGYLNLRVAHANNSGNITDFIRLRGDVAGAVVINDSGRADVDFRIETDTNNTAFLIDASANTAEINVPLNLGSTLTHYNNTAPAAGQLLIGDATAGVWDAATLTAGSNITITNADGAITIAASGGGGGGSPGGANTQVQFNNSGAFGADGNFIYDSTAPAVAVGFTPAGQTSGSINTDALMATNTVDSGIITGAQKVGTPAFVQQGATPPTYGLTLTDANMVWPGAALGSSSTIMPVIDLSAGNYDFATLNGAGNCSQTHYLFIQVGQAPNAILMPDPAAVGLPAGARWTIHNLDNSGNTSLIEFGASVVPPCPPLSQTFGIIEFTGIGSVTLFTDGVEWFVESDTCVQNRGALTINYL